MSPQPKQKPVVHVIGGGIGGLALAQVLRKADIPCQVFEREESATARSQGWGLGLTWVLPDILKSFPTDLPPVETSSCEYEMGIDASAKIWKGDTKELLMSSGGHGVKLIRVSRASFRTWLRTNIDVQWNKQFVKYTKTADGRITTYFADGTTATCDILIGADGVRSRVRDAVYGENGPKLKHLPVILYAAEFDALPSEYAVFEDIGRSVCVAFTDSARFFMAPQYIRPSGARFLCGVAPLDERGTDPTFWKELLAKSPEQWLDDMRAVIKTMHPDFQQFINRLEPKELHPPLPIRDILPEPLPTGNVTLLGDAFHAMGPFKGEGAQHAIRDATHLGTLIAQAVDTNGDIAACLKEYETATIPRTTEAVLSARKAVTSLQR
ncbi:hypothetical protein RI367_003414 [Sorochytrium milnesiophthora]